MLRTARVAALASVGLFAALCLPAAQGATTPSTQTAQDHSSRIAGFYDQRPQWHRCKGTPGAPAAYQCATTTVPVDYAHPNGRTLHPRISRIRTSTPAKRHGVLLSSPGGPGGPGLGDPLRPKDTLAKSVLQRYDLIGFNPRGLAASSPLHRGLTSDEADPPNPYGCVSDEGGWLITLRG